MEMSMNDKGCKCIIILLNTIQHVDGLNRLRQGLVHYWGIYISPIYSPEEKVCL